MKSFRIEPNNIILGSVLRWAVFHLLERRDLRYDPLRSAAMNDLIFGDIVQVPSRSFKDINPIIWSDSILALIGSR